MSDFSTLGLDGATVLQELEDLGIDVSEYDADELSSIMLASHLLLEYAIFSSAEGVEELLFEYNSQTNTLAGMDSTLQRLRETVGANVTTSDDGANATFSDLIDFLEGFDTYVDMDDTSIVEVDQTFSTVLGIDTVTLSFESLADFVSAVGDNESFELTGDEGTIHDTSALEVIYYQYLFDGTFLGIVDADGSSMDLSDFLDGTEGYIQVDQDCDTFDLYAYLDLDGFKQYLIANALQDAGYISDDVYIEPVIFADTTLSDDTFPYAADWAQWLQLYFGKVAVTYDTTEDTLSVDLSGAAGVRASGLDLADYFGATSWYLVSELPEPIAGEDDNQTALIVVTASYAFGDFGDTMGISSGSYLDGSVTAYDWDVISGDVLTMGQVYSETCLDADDLDDLLEDFGSAIQSEASTGQLALVEVSTALSEWGELHSAWDTVHKYVTDALDRAVSLIK